MKGTKSASSNKWIILHVRFDAFSQLKDAVLGSPISSFDAPIRLWLRFLEGNQFSLEGTTAANQPEILNIVPGSALSRAAPMRLRPRPISILSQPAGAVLQPAKLTRKFVRP
jgi:hypothetical protein